jgi:FtsP/CotA-like multicopper oxidase with cupredoxin domain
MPASPRRRTLELATALVAAAALATGCGGTADEPTVISTGPAQTEEASPTAEVTSPGEPTKAADDGATVVEVTVSAGSVSTPLSRVDVEVGTPVRLVVTSDTHDELHVHGVDLEQPLVAGQPTVLEFVPPEPGVYDVETHDSHLMLVQIAAR